jgi:cell division septation protein DedD
MPMRQSQDDRYDPRQAPGPDDDVAYDVETPPRRPRWRLYATIGVAVVAVFGFGAIVAYGYLSYADRHALAPAPLVTADPRPARTKPENDGALAIPHKNIAVFGAGQRSAEEAAGRGAETLLPLPEAPLPRPVPSPAAQAVPVSARPDGAAQMASVPSSLPAAPAVLPPADATQAAIGVAAPLRPVPPPPPAPVRSAAAAPQAATAPVPAQPAQAAPASGFRIQVGAMRTEAEARTAWDQVQRRHPEILGRLAPSFARVELGERGSFFRVQAGPLPSRDAARSACERLSKAGTVCFVVPPA